MLYEFQVFYRKGETHSIVDAPIDAPSLLSQVVRAETPEEARQILSQIGMVVVNVGPGLPIVDWSKPVLDAQEACVFLDVSDRTLRDLQAAGEIPRPHRNGRSLFRMDELERYRRKTMQVEQWEGKK